jgi:ferredoxin
MLSRLLNLFRANDPEQGAKPAAPPAGMYQVTADASRCVQCGICGYNCPVGIEVREYARRGENVTDTRCISCGACIEKCPRGTLKWGQAILIRSDDSLEIAPNDLPQMLHLQSRKLP